jgi:cellulose synthase/poly-beta-1,6-N-acetylglucosamine synthase-like glycosyltransferase
MQREASITKSVSIGICAYNEAARISGLIDSLDGQALPPGYMVTEILVVASGCTDGTDRIVDERARFDPRLTLIRETERRGKASALNQILGAYQGEILILVNADARLRPDSLFHLVREFDADPTVEVACGSPTPEASTNSIVNLIEQVWWRLHNRTLQTLSDRGQGNHCCDELMALRRGFVASIPRDVINDGAYFGVLGALRGNTVRFVRDAPVSIETPSGLLGLLRQRRRILAGHRQVRGLLGRFPATLEGLIRSDPGAAARIVGSEFVASPWHTAIFLCLAGPFEIVSYVFSRLDFARGRGSQAAWPMVE